MRTGVNIGGAEALVLKGAILVYEGRGTAFVSWHQTRTAGDGGAPFLGEAEPLTTDFLHTLAACLGSQVSAEVLPANVLVRTPDVLMWWTPAQHRTMFFAENSEAGKELNASRYPHPPLVFKAAGAELWVRALVRNERAAADTRLMTAPYWNTNDLGYVCVGSMRTPEHDGLDAMEIWERGFFQSEFTHAYGAARLTSFPGGFLALWKHLAGRTKAFPARYLTDARQTLREFVEAR
jgi:PRTRC genetic system protein B